MGVEAYASYQGIVYEGRISQVREAYVHLTTPAGVFAIPKSFLRKKPNLHPHVSEQLRKFLDVAAGEGYIFDGVDAAELYLTIFGEPV